MKRFLIVFLFVITIAMFVLAFFIYANKPVNTVFEGVLHTMSLGSTTIDVAIAGSQETRQKGLSNLKYLPKNHGLLFLFPENGTHSIWMKDMKFPIDIIWLDETLQVVDIKKEVSPDTYPTSFHPKVPSRYVLEVSEGFSQKNDIEIGSVVFLETL